jgi:hypothetical protein
MKRKILVGVCCLFAQLGLSHGRLASAQESNRYLQGNASNDEMIDVIVGYKSSANVASLSSSSSTGTVSAPRSKRTNTAAARISASELITLQNDPDVAYVERNNMKYLYSETTPWGIDAVQGGFNNIIPTPSTSKDCFKVCVVDSGFLLGHPDLVSSTGSYEYYVCKLAYLLSLCQMLTIMSPH